VSERPLAVVVQNPSSALALPDAACFARWVQMALGECEGDAGEVTVRIVDGGESRALNKRYRGQDRPTNVLAFPAGSVGVALPAGEAAPIGDLVICAAVVREEARRRGIPEEAHWAHLVVHGCLHLSGWDHQQPAEARDMEARETKLLARLGYGDPYA
jgi:probable rRNA maturation factor